MLQRQGLQLVRHRLNGLTKFNRVKIFIYYGASWTSWWNIYFINQLTPLYFVCLVERVAFFMYSMKKARKIIKNNPTTTESKTICFFLDLTGADETSGFWITLILLIFSFAEVNSLICSLMLLISTGNLSALRNLSSSVPIPTQDSYGTFVPNVPNSVGETTESNLSSWQIPPWPALHSWQV